MDASESQNIVTPLPTTNENIQEEQECEDDPNIYTLTIFIGEIQGLKPVYPISDVQLTVVFGEDTLFESEKVPMSNLISINHNVLQTFDVRNQETMNKYITTPIIFSLLEYPSTPPDIEIEEMGTRPLGQNDIVCGKVLWRSEESILELEQALFGTQTELPETKKEASRKGLNKIRTKSSIGSAGSKPSKKSKTSKASKVNALGKAQAVDIDKESPSGPQIAGTAIVDLVGLFLEHIAISEILVLKACADSPLDDRMMSVSNLPTLQVNIFLNKELPKGNIFYYTVESIYNLPNVMSSKMNYQMVIGIPIDVDYKLVPFDNFTFAQAPREQYTFKKYYGSPEFSNFILKDDFDDVQCNLPMEFSDAYFSDFPRLEFNIIKSEFVSDDGIEVFRNKLKKYRYIGIELFMSNPDFMDPVKKISTENNQVRKTSVANSKESKRGSRKEIALGSRKSSRKFDADENEEEFLHLMAFVDVCKLLYPGEQSIRIACEVRTFNMEEFEEACGLRNSYFRPKPPSPEPPKRKESLKEEESMSKKKDKKDKSEKSSKANAESKSAKGKKGRGNLASKLPEIPVPAPSSKPVYNEDGFPTFIIVEFEFRNSVVPKYEVQDLHNDLEDIINNLPKSPDTPRVFKSKYVCQDLFKNSVRTIFQQLKEDYLKYIEEDGKKEDVLEFVQYITKNEKYEVYLNTITKSAARFCDVNRKYDPNWSQGEFHAFIGGAYIDLVELTNETLNQIDLADDVAPKEPHDNNAGLLFYAKEATEIDAMGLAQHYYLQRISENDTNGDYWLDYGIFKMQINETSVALECATEALKHGPSNRDCLIFFGLLTARQGKYSEAETCLLNVTINNPRWVEGWMALYCLYQRTKNFEGLEVSLELAEKYNKEKQFSRFEDINWCASILPDKCTFRAIKYLINLRLLEEAEMILADELLRRNTDITEYLLAVLSLLKGQFAHAMEHIDQSSKLGPCSYAKNMVRGHILMALGKLDCALIEYEKITKLGDEVPHDSSVHLTFIRAGLCYSALGMHQLARKILLKASEKQGTPYSWLATGVLYYHQHDYLSAEECLTAANSLDNIMPETWAYLTLTNIKMGRPNEATSCYHQAINNRLQNQELIKTVNNELEQWEKGFFDSIHQEEVYEEETASKQAGEE